MLNRIQILEEGRVLLKRKIGKLKENKENFLEGRQKIDECI